MAAYDPQTKLFKAIGHPARLAILDVEKLLNDPDIIVNQDVED